MVGPALQQRNWLERRSRREKDETDLNRRDKNLDGWEIRVGNVETQGQMLEEHTRLRGCDTVGLWANGRR